MNIPEIHALFLKCSSIVIDTRKTGQGSLFVALRGERFDANTFAAEALEKGASYVIIDNADYHIDARTILVKDSLEALQQLAAFHRQYLKLPIIALTGSNGKTTTKELISAVLSAKYNTKATIGNLNNHIGVPLTLLSFSKATQIGIVEMGANHQKEIEFLCGIAQPDYGYITNFGKAHLEGFGGVEGVIKGKSEMYAYLRENGKTAFVNLDDAIQDEKTRDIDRITFSQSNDRATVSIKNVEANPFVTIAFGDLTVKSHLIGLYNANNINAAITIGKHFEVPDFDIKRAIQGYVPDNNRSQLITKGTNEIILDAYNANPSSMKVALENFLQLGARAKGEQVAAKPGKTLIIGDMFELGGDSLSEHKAIVDALVDAKNVNCIFVGSDFYASQQQQEHFRFFRTFDDFSDYFAANQPQGHIILIKGSRGMALERTLELL